MTLDTRIAYLAYAFFVAGVICVIVSVVPGEYGALWSMLYPLPLVGTYWPVRATGAWLFGNTLVMIGFVIWCTPSPRRIARALRSAAGSLVSTTCFVTESRAAPAQQPPQMFAAAITAIDGIISNSLGMAYGVAMMIVHWLDASVPINPLWAKNLIYQFGHTFANLTIYIAVAGLYVGWLCTKAQISYLGPIGDRVVGDAAVRPSCIFPPPVHGVRAGAGAPVHRRDRVVSCGSPGRGRDGISSCPARPSLRITVGFGSDLPLRWHDRVGRGRHRGAPRHDDPVNLDLHDTLWVPGRFHTYLLEGILLFIIGWLFVSLEQRSSALSPLIVRWLAGVGVFGGGALFLLGFSIAGAQGVPRRYAIEPYRVRRWRASRRSERSFWLSA